MKHSRIFVFAVLLAGIAAKPNQAAPKQMAKLSKVFVVGKVQKPGMYSFSGKWRLLHAIGVAGGMTAKPDSLQLSVHRGNKTFPINMQRLLSLDESQNLPLLSGDVVFVGIAQSTSVPTVPPE